MNLIQDPQTDSTITTLIAEILQNPGRVDYFTEHGEQFFASGLLEPALIAWSFAHGQNAAPFADERTVADFVSNHIDILEKNQTMTRAIQAFQAAHQSGQDVPLAIYRLFLNFFFCLGLFPSAFIARHELEKRLNLSINASTYTEMYNLGIVYAYCGQLDNALATLQKCCELASETFEYQFKLPAILTFTKTARTFQQNQALQWPDVHELRNAQRHSPVERMRDLGIDEEDARLWLRKGFDSKSARKWIELHFSPEEAHTYSYTGIQPEICLYLRDNKIAVNNIQNKDDLKSPEKLAVWKNHGYSTAAIVRWCQEGLNFEAARTWQGVNISSKDASEWQRFGFIGSEGKDWLQHNFSPQTARAWKNQQFFAEDAHAWVELRFDPIESKKWQQLCFSAANAAKWRQAGFIPDDATDWALVGFSADMARQWKTGGFSPDEALIWLAKDRTPQIARQEVGQISRTQTQMDDAVILFWGIACAESELPWVSDIDRDTFWDCWKQRFVRRSPDTKLLDLGCIIGIYGRPASFGRCFVAAAESLVETRAGHPKKFNPSQFRDERRQNLQRFCQILDIPWQEPRWWLVSRMMT